MSGTASLAVRVAGQRVEARDILSFELEAVDGRPLPAFSAGAHIDVHMPGGWVRPYSLCNPPQDGAARYLICVQKEPASRGGSRAMHDSVKLGDVLHIGAPRNLFPLVPDSAHSLLLAGGIGITPLLSMAAQLAAQQASFTLHHAVRSRDRAALWPQIEASAFAARARLHCDDGEPGQRLDLDAVLAGAPAGCHLYVCGPGGFMQAVQAAAARQGWPAERVHSESFTGAVQDHSADEAFELVLARSGRSVMVPRGCSASEALAAAGAAVPTSCEQGVCGTCLTSVLEGRPDHRDLYLSPEEQALNDRFLPCCSRALTPRLVLDI